MSSATAVSGRQGISTTALIAVTVFAEIVVVSVLVLQVTGAAPNVNATTEALLAIIVLVAMIPFASAVRLPGGEGLTLRDTSRTAALVGQVVSSSVAGQTQSPDSLSQTVGKVNLRYVKAGQQVSLAKSVRNVDLLLSRVSDTDLEVHASPSASPPLWKELVMSSPALGTSAMRYDIQGHLRDLVASRSIPLEGPASDVRSLVRSLASAGVLTAQEQEAVISVMDLASQAVLARRINTNAAEQLSNMGEDILRLLSVKSSQLARPP